MEEVMKAMNRRGVFLRLGMLASLLLTLALASVQAMPAVAQERLAAAAASPIYKANPMGNLLLVGPLSGPSIPSSPSGWNDVPGLSGAVYSRSGDNLEITITAEISGPGTVH